MRQFSSVIIVSSVLVAAFGWSVLLSPTLAAEGNAARGERVFRACAACHSLQPDQNMTGPSLANIWNRKAGILASFPRYSSALKSSQIVWNDKTLDEWIKDPQQLVPGNEMTFPGVKDDQQRADLMAFLKRATQGGRAAQRLPPGGGMMGGGEVPNLKTLDADERVKTIQLCHDTYRVTTQDGKTRQFWERNLRFKTDSSNNGPEEGAPAVLPAGMMGDRASVIFGTPEEISGFIHGGC